MTNHELVMEIKIEASILASMVAVLKFQPGEAAQLQQKHSKVLRYPFPSAVTGSTPATPPKCRCCPPVWHCTAISCWAHFWPCVWSGARGGRDPGMDMVNWADKTCLLRGCSGSCHRLYSLLM